MPFPTEILEKAPSRKQTHCRYHRHFVWNVARSERKKKAGERPAT